MPMPSAIMSLSRWKWSFHFFKFHLLASSVAPGHSYENRMIPQYFLKEKFGVNGVLSTVAVEFNNLSASTPGSVRWSPASAICQSGCWGPTRHWFVGWALHHVAEGLHRQRTSYQCRAENTVDLLGYSVPAFPPTS
ncbi:hypothetical protein J3A83DRAFT_2208989 [Scleroderma citrinum]